MRPFLMLFAVAAVLVAVGPKTFVCTSDYGHAGVIYVEITPNLPIENDEAKNRLANSFDQQELFQDSLVMVYYPGKTVIVLEPRRLEDMVTGKWELAKVNPVVKRVLQKHYPHFKFVMASPPQH